MAFCNIGGGVWALAKYATFGTFADLEAVPVLEAPDLEDPRSVSPGAPRAVYLGLRLSF